MVGSNENRIDVIVVVSGQDVQITVNPHQKVAELVREALRESGNQGQPVENWVLKRVDGSTIDFEHRIADSNITSGMKLFLNPKAGEGGR